ncbi:hypothetical protein [Variovorax sp. LG9.2]|uniref:hypothetical protein n=1 Tax=Variovorax sp. LG9.2 TaxID=3048626 RepID=UPI002B22DFBA|nr:hypothetical protein [Variovorax sp. LG9.2]MEB0059243.1 hypothetical protein [Variovorax sp. LG9.2]
MTTIQMNSGLGSTCTVTLPLPSSASVSLVGGIGAVNPEDVDLCLRLNWTVLANQPWPAARVVRMTVPTVGAWGATITFPDGTTAPVASGIAKIPQAWVTWALGYGFAV